MVQPKPTAHLNTKAVRHRMTDLDIADLRTLAHRAGADYSGLCKTMNQTREPSMLLVMRLSAALGMTLDSLIQVKLDEPVEVAA